MLTIGRRIIKCSILAFYRRITPSRKHHIILYIFACVMIIHALMTMLAGVSVPILEFRSLTSSIAVDILYWSSFGMVECACILRPTALLYALMLQAFHSTIQWKITEGIIIPGTFIRPTQDFRCCGILSFLHFQHLSSINRDSENVIKACTRFATRLTWSKLT